MSLVGTGAGRVSDENQRRRRAIINSNHVEFIVSWPEPSPDPGRLPSAGIVASVQGTEGTA